MSEIIRFEYDKDGRKIYPAHWMVKNWQFPDGEEEEAVLANQLAIVAEKNGMSANDVQHLFPAILRMMKSDSVWSE